MLLPASFTLAIRGRQWSCHQPGHCPEGKEIRYRLDRTLGGSKGRFVNRTLGGSKGRFVNRTLGGSKGRFVNRILGGSKVRSVDRIFGGSKDRSVCSTDNSVPIGQDTGWV